MSTRQTGEQEPRETRHFPQRRRFPVISSDRTIAQASENPVVIDRSERSRQATYYRVEAIYFATVDIIEELLGRSRNHADFGTYDGFGLPPLLSVAEHVDTIDISDRRLDQARRRPELKESIASGKLKILKQNAAEVVKQQDRETNPELLQLETYSSATCIEVFQADPKKMSVETQKQILTNMYGLLEEGGIGIFTFPCDEAASLGDSFHFVEHRGVAMSALEVEEHCHALGFRVVKKLGQVIMTEHEDGSHTIPALVDHDGTIHRETYVPQEVRVGQIPQYWIYVVQKQAST